MLHRIATWHQNPIFQNLLGIPKGWVFAMFSPPPQNHISSACCFSCPHSLVVPKTPCHHPRPGHACVEPPNDSEAVADYNDKPNTSLRDAEAELPNDFQNSEAPKSIKNKSLAVNVIIEGWWQCTWLVKTCQNSLVWEIRVSSLQPVMWSSVPGKTAYFFCKISFPRNLGKSWNTGKSCHWELLFITYHSSYHNSITFGNQTCAPGSPKSWSIVTRVIVIYTWSVNIMVHNGCVRIAAFEPYFNKILYINKNPALPKNEIAPEHDGFQ